MLAVSDDSGTTDQRLLTHADLLELLSVYPTPEAEDARRVLVASDVDMHKASPVAASDIESIYRRRLRRMPKDDRLVPSIDRLIQSTADTPGEKIYLVVVDGEDQVFSVWLSQELDRVISVFSHERD